MPNTPVTGNGPFEFTDTFGRQVSIPLTAFTVDPVKGIVPDANWAAVFTSLPATAVPASSLLAYMIAEKLIQPAPTPAPAPAVIFKAADSGTAGNNITVKITAGTPNSDPTLTTFNIVVTEEETYTGLTIETIASVLGTSDAAGNPLASGSRPGLVRVLKGSDLGIGTPAALNAPLAGDPAILKVDESGSPPLAFTLVAKKTGADGALTRVDITPDSGSPHPVPETFTLVVSWQKEVDGVSISTLQSQVQALLSYEIAVSVPTGGAFSVPAAGTITLSGGASGVAASAATFTGA